MTPELVTHLIEAAGAGLIGLMGWLLRRSIFEVDSHLSNQDLHLSRQDGKLDGLATKWSEHDRAIAVLMLRVSHLEAGEQVRRAEHEQFAGFLQAQGFRRSEGEQGPK